MQDTVRETEDSGSGGAACATCTYDYYVVSELHVTYI